jgi:hypothetical protein
MEGKKSTTKIFLKKLRNSIAGCSLLRAEGFFWSLDVLRGDYKLFK